MKTGTKKIILSGIFFIFILILFSPFIIPKALNTLFVKQRISDFIYQKTQIFITPSNLNLSVFPKASLAIQNFKLNLKNDIDINIESVMFNLDHDKLLQGKIRLGKIFIDNPIILFASKKKELPRQSFFKLFEQLPALTKNIFTFLPEHDDLIEVGFKNTISPHFKHMEGSLSLSEDKNLIILKTNISNINLNISKSFDNLFEEHLNLSSIELAELKLNVTFESHGSIKGSCDFISPKIRSKKNDLLIDSDVINSSFNLSNNLIEIDIKPSKFNYPAAIFSSHYTANHDLKKTVIQFSGSNIHVDQAKKTSLSLFKNNKITEQIFEIVRNGFVPKVIVSFQNSDIKNLFDPYNLRLNGNITKGLVHIPNTKLSVSNVLGKAQITKGILDINVTKGTVENSFIEKGTLKIDLLNYQNYPFNGDFLLDVDLSRVPETLISLLPNTVLERELSLVHEVKGRAKANLNLAFRPNTDDLDVIINTKDFSIIGSYDRIPRDIELENLKFNYEDDVVLVQNLTGMINGNKIIDLNAKIDFQNTTFFEIQSGSGAISLDSTIPWLMSYAKIKNMLSPLEAAKGKAYFNSLSMKGPVLDPEKWEYNLKGTGEDIDLAILDSSKIKPAKIIPAKIKPARQRSSKPLKQYQLQKLFCQYDISNSHFNLYDIQMKMNNFSWLEHFTENIVPDSIICPVNIRNGIVKTDPKQSILRSDIQTINGPAILIHLAGKTIGSLSLVDIKLIDKGFSNASVTFNEKNNILPYKFNGILNSATINKVIKPENYWVKKLDELTKGEPLLLFTDKDSNLNITTKSIDLTPFFSQSSNKLRIDHGSIPAESINFKADKLKIKKLKFTDVDSKLFLKQKKSYIKVNNVSLCDLKTSGTINMRNKQVSASISLNADNNPNIQDLLTCLFNKNDFMNGQYSLEADIKTSFSQQKILNKLSGPFQFKAQKGRIYQLTLLSRILSVLNISQILKGSVPNIVQDGFAYKTIVIEGDIRENKIFLSKAIINGEDMTLIFSGWIDPFNDEIDLTCLVSPFKTADLIIEKIPIVNTLFGNRLVAVPAKATGKLFDPVVIPLHPSAVGKGLLDMMSTILKTPVTLWDKISGE